ncbi:uncharacterized protein KY384_001036 [Bacidia gigantensis]|uniref:uncharacterized protein n=1 Tax=Bacidia gigantensis TaxID=2732470 RepID=UPI001D0594ED|nr:uncharacterized protein KY384_001036 [Bacidia gigantensis]KAG8534192.1 hypothetical protein KY384_001036 [Bacidia gigantensis]
MTQASLRPPNLQPRPKAVPTFSSTSIGAISRSTTPQLSRPSSQSRHVSPVRYTTTTDVSDRATTTLIRRVLCPQALSGTEKERPIDEFLPPLTSSNEVDLQLYAIIAIIVKDLVQSWYGKITPDQTFVEEVVKIIAHCTRALESRIRLVDIENLILDEIPTLVDRHIQAFRVSYDDAQSQGPSTISRTIYHNLIPHPALTPIPNPAVPGSFEEQARNESNYRQLLAQGALAILLPTEDLENACLRTLVADVIAEPILGISIGGKVCESWLIWSSVTKLVDTVKGKAKAAATDGGIDVDTRSRLQKFGLLSEKEEKTARSSEDGRSWFSCHFWRVLFWRILQYIYLAVFVTRSIVAGLWAASSEPPRSSTLPKSPRSASRSPHGMSFQTHVEPRPILRLAIFPLLSTIVDLPHRMPWLAGGLALLRHHLSLGSLRVIGGTDAIFDQ